MSERVTNDDLAAAITWLNAYEGEGGHDEMAASMRKVSAYLERELARRREEALIRAAQRAHPGLSTHDARKYLRAVENARDAR